MLTGAFRRLFAAILGGLCITGCTPDGEIQPVHFAVVDSLLGDTVKIETARIEFRVPRDFHSDSSQVNPADSVRKQPVYAANWNHEVVGEYTCGKGGSLSVTRIDSLGLNGDTAAFMSALRSHLMQIYGERHLTWGDYTVGDLYVKNLLVTDSTCAQFYLLLFGPTTSTVQLRYRVPRSQYADLLMPLESSIGSAHTISPADSLIR